MTLYIGIDGGGTKTDLGLFDSQLNLLNQVTTTSVHPLQKTLAESTEVLKSGLNALLKTDTKDQQIYVGLGLAGYGNNAELRHRIEKMCAQVFQMPYSIHNDAEIALAGALDNKDGILIIAGTGSMGLANVNEKVIRVGGWGYQIGDEGSAFWIAQRMIREYTQQIDGRKPVTLLKEAIEKQFKISDPYDIIEVVSTQLYNQRTIYAKLAQLGSDLYRESDFAVKEIFTEAAKELAQLANTLVQHFDSNVTLSYIGGVWEMGADFHQIFAEYLDDRIIVQPPKNTPIYGAALLVRDDFADK